MHILKIYLGLISKLSNTLSFFCFLVNCNEGDKKSDFLCKLHQTISWSENKWHIKLKCDICEGSLMQCAHCLEIQQCSNINNHIRNKNISFFRFRVAKSGKWSVHVCVVKSRVNVKLLSHYFVLKQNQANENSGRYT